MHIQLKVNAPHLNIVTCVTEEQEFFSCFSMFWSSVVMVGGRKRRKRKEKDLETTQKQKLNLSISVCAGWRQCMMKPLEKSRIKSFSRQQETITFQVSLASRVTRLIWHLQSEIDAESFRSPSSGSGELPRDHYSALKQEGSQIVGS